MSHYGQFCPVAKAAEIFGERWTLLVMRELLLGTTRFSDLQRALAKASPSILAKRLRQLEAAGVLRRVRAAGGGHAEYRLTRAGREVAPLIEHLGTWATRWAPARLTRDELDEYYLLLDFSRRVVLEALPRGPLSIGFCFRRPWRTPSWWTVIRDGQIDICDRDPGYGVDLLVGATLRDLTAVWLGQVSLASARRDGLVQVSGERALERSIGRWFGLSAFARRARRLPPRSA
ncbi:MAG: helix-turn-helix domain-containing protein [Gammaproteobacteria bacterium]